MRFFAEPCRVATFAGGGFGSASAGVTGGGRAGGSSASASSSSLPEPDSSSTVDRDPSVSEPDSDIGSTLEDGCNDPKSLQNDLELKSYRFTANFDHDR
jgi:hypothetical protein